MRIALSVLSWVSSPLTALSNKLDKWNIFLYIFAHSRNWLLWPANRYNWTTHANIKILWKRNVQAQNKAHFTERFFVEIFFALTSRVSGWRPDHQHRWRSGATLSSLLPFSDPPSPGTCEPHLPGTWCSPVRKGNMFCSRNVNALHCRLTDTRRNWSRPWFRRDPPSLVKMLPRCKAAAKYLALVAKSQIFRFGLFAPSNEYLAHNTTRHQRCNSPVDRCSCTGRVLPWQCGSSWVPRTARGTAPWWARGSSATSGASCSWWHRTKRQEPAASYPPR